MSSNNMTPANWFMVNSAHVQPMHNLRGKERIHNAIPVCITRKPVRAGELVRCQLHVLVAMCECSVQKNAPTRDTQAKRDLVQC